MYGSGTGVEPFVPHGDQQVWVSDSERARQVDRVRSSEPVLAREVAGTALDGVGQLDRTSRRPVLLPRGLGGDEVLIGEVAVSVGCCQRGADFRIREAARQRGVPAVPNVSGETATQLVDDEFHEGAGVEVREGHVSDAVRSPVLQPTAAPEDDVVRWRAAARFVQAGR